MIDLEGTPNPLPVLGLSLSPLGETVVAFDRKNNLNIEGLRSFASSAGMREVDFEWIAPGATVITSLSGEHHDGHAPYLFGGRSFSKSGELIIRGDGRIPESGHLNSADDIVDTTGEFHILKLDYDSMRFSADHFGIQQIVYFDNGSTFVAATSYHLLLKAVYALALPLEVDNDRSRRILNESRVFHSRVSIDMKHCAVLAIYEHIEITRDGPRIVMSEMHDTLYKRAEYSEERYAKLITQARDEIVRNMQMVFECDTFEAVVVDLSGGMDSRLLYAACTLLPQTLVRRKIQINCQYAPSPTATRGGDLEVALELNSIWKYPMLNNDTPARTWIDLETEGRPDEIAISKISRNFGLHKNYNHITPKHVERYCANVVRISGFVGECYRSADSQDPRDATSYINFRNRYMTSRAFENIISPLASKSALEAALYYQRNHPDDNILRTVFDILIALNPLLAKVRFHNQSLREFVSSAGFGECLNSPLGLSVNVDPIADPKPTHLKTEGGSRDVEQFVFERKNVEAMMDQIVRYDPNYADILARVDPGTAAQNNTTIYRLWNLYFSLDIAEGRG